MGNPRMGRSIYFALIVFCIACSADDKKTEDAAANDGGVEDAKTPEGGAVTNGDSSAAKADGSAKADSATSTDSGQRADGAWIAPIDSSIVRVMDGGVTIKLPDGGTSLCYRITCNNKMLQCGDCQDNDGDGLIDSFDPECLGPCDNTEGPALEPGIGGDTGDQCKRDCYFDYGNGAGNDDCRWAYNCDPLAPKDKCGYKASMVGGGDCPNGQSQQCLDLCRPITPNGCDCFGCCTFPELAGKGQGSKDKYVWIGRTEEPFCTFSSVTDPAACPPCTPEPSCLNTCGRCEICIGKPTIPDDCIKKTSDGGIPQTDSGIPKDGGTQQQDSGIPRDGGDQTSRCDPGVQPCGLAGDAPCATGEYCITGCCITITIM